ncbi:protein draper-like [Diabrotica virgifera virgifera]|uniref:EMI domain-containing protein n=1 Tax=Diabrotica virgifera virgifera TaxID=50390 RepID=A0ABM5LB25_DIAVI|nr:protein draper-like [Diabrotica virgifera virgifera]
MGLQHALSILLLINIFNAYGKLTGDHICLTEKLYLANVTETYLKNVILRNYKWCLNFPPRCSFYTNKQISATRVVTPVA